MFRCYHALFLVVAFAVATVRSEDTCDKIGPQCSPDGTKVWMCTEKGKAPEEAETCSDGEKCQEKEDKVACMSPSTAELRFKCTGKGEFPDPKDCSQTYICSGGEEPAEVCKCPGGSFVYPEQGLFCVPEECPRKNIACTEGATGYFELNNGEKTNYYYYCSKADVVEVYEGIEVPDGKNLRRAALRAMKNGKECKPFDDSSTTEPPKSTSTTEGTTESSSTTTMTTEPTPKPTEPTSKPTDPTAKPTEPTSKPTDPTAKPTEPTSKPTDPTDKPSDPTAKPTEPTTKATDPTDKPSDPTTKPTEPTTKATDPTDKPSDPTTKPTEPTTKPTDPTDKPTDPTTKPTEPTTKPTEPTTKPTEPTTKPTEPTTKPTEPTTKPTEPTTKPTDPTTKPTEPTTTPKPEQKPKCKEQGELHETECDCDFYECNKKLVPKRRTCRAGMKYYPKFKRCIYGECDESKCIYRPK